VLEELAVKEGRGAKEGKEEERMGKTMLLLADSETICESELRRQSLSSHTFLAAEADVSEPHSRIMFLLPWHAALLSREVTLGTRPLTLL
jgi:hypothetical protein